MKMFQSHCGAIRTRSDDRLFRSRRRFQSHCGAIRTEADEKFDPGRFRFNPTVVRLGPLVSKSSMKAE